jgi:hypothetical protein
MLRQVSRIAAGAVVLLAVGGCTLDQFRVNFLGLSPDAGGHLVAGSLESVEASTTGILRQMGLFVTSSRAGETVRLSGATRTGRRFTLVLRRQKTEQGEQTRVNIEWQNERDDNFWFELGGQLVGGGRVSSPAPGTTPQVQESTALPPIMTGARGPGQP